MSTLSRPTPRFRHFVTAFATAAMLHAGSAQAASSEWATNEGGRMRLVVLPAAADGTLQAALQIEPTPGWITYWREPGDAGIPPAISLDPESQLTLGEISFPVPKRIDNGDIRDIGYDTAVTLPFTIQGAVTATDTVKANVFIGICKNICIPFQAELTVALDATSDPEEDAILASARRALPEPASGNFGVDSHQMSGALDRLDLSLELPSPDNHPQVFVTGPSGHVFMDYEVVSAAGGKLAISMPIEELPRNYKIAGKTWGILVLSGNRAMESTLAFD
ncbi:hypothetical protein NBH19_04940 [Rhizobium sp. S95]|uniref:Thiol:disulfide interchange protein DsbD N-terminal domain-containing protein n=1 Tax=Ciceribacter sichuanensis TaxID=2949647 RepID=A0AAJ1BT26_9HYPH|nr:MULTISPECIES: protein-disulfide reductase DsbD domain-containing protein [unclassified Ciceribacter]MCM2395434.1 hypothetical protein [Ciceribacter sp. S95]MCO5955856.1 hypothetical protein [Ciceribacter sp. S101]